VSSRDPAGGVHPAPPSDGRRSSRPLGRYAKVTGTLRGAPVIGLIRTDGSFSGHLALVDRGRSSPTWAALGGTPLLATLLIARACDSVVSVELFGAGKHISDLPAGAIMHVSNGEHPPFSVGHRDLGGDHVVSFYGELDLAGSVLAEEALVKAAGSTVVLDLSGLTFLDAKGLQAILSAKQRIEAQGDQIRIRGAFGIVRRIFDLTDLGHWLDD
jgi:anti-anti-sigma factor